MTRGRPDDGRPDAVRAWTRAEADKRRLIHQLDGLALPVEGRSSTTPNGLAFDLVYLPGERGLTGHLDGLVTLDLGEVDDRHRDDLRRSLHEPFRTLIGNLRHEIGHHFWHRLVAQSDHLRTARMLFGDERVDYASALARHYSNPDEPWDDTRFITRYAAAHPLEDWAETFAHYLHIIDMTETAAAFGLRTDDPSDSAQAVDAVPFAVVLDRWRGLMQGLDAITESVGSSPIYPIAPTGSVVDKLEFVHARITGHNTREQFYGAAVATPRSAP